MGDKLFGSKTESQSVPQYVTDLGTDAANLARERNEMGYIPYYGPETAAFTPMQVAQMHGANLQAGALGLPQAEGSFVPQTSYDNGLQGYNSAGIMEDSLARLKEANPDVYNLLMKLKDMQQPEQQPFFSPAKLLMRAMMFGSDGEGSGTYAASRGSRGSGGSGGAFGYTSGRDMIDGGGKGKSGSTFVGGRLSDRLNTLGITPKGSRS